MKKAIIYNIKAEKVGDISLPKNIFESSVSEKLISQYIRVFLANQRKSYAKTKTRSQVIGTTKKVWAQKGTGRARHGSEKAPIFVGGGIAQGPRGDQNYTLKISKKMKKQALNALLSKFAANNNIIVIDKFTPLIAKTKEGLKFLSGLKAENEVLSKSRKIGIITTKTLDNVSRAFGNLKGINLMSLQSLNAYDLSKQNYLIFSQKTIQKLK